MLFDFNYVAVAKNENTTSTELSFQVLFGSDATVQGCYKEFASFLSGSTMNPKRFQIVKRVNVADAIISLEELAPIVESCTEDKLEHSAENEQYKMNLTIQRLN